MGKRARIQTGLRLDSDTVDRLKQSGRGLSDEIRERLERTFKDDALDPVTRELQQVVADIAEVVRQDFGDWHGSRRAHAVFAAILARHLTDYAPPKAAPGTAVSVSDLFAAEIDDSQEAIDAIAQIRARDNQRAHSYPQLETAQKRRTGRMLRHLRGRKEGNHD